VSAELASEGLLREATPQALGALLRRFGDFADCEDALQEAQMAAARQWPVQGTPASPVAWLCSCGFAADERPGAQRGGKGAT
jgi:predicted RNA polymerase sigma factor